MMLARAAVASVWLYEGLWCKLLAADAGQRAIVAGVPGIGAAPGVALAAIGVAETALAGWVFSGRAPRLAAAVQTGVLVAFNAGGLLFGREQIGDPGRMLTANAALLAAAWLLTGGAPECRRGRVLCGAAPEFSTAPRRSAAVAEAAAVVTPERRRG